MYLGIGQEAADFRVGGLVGVEFPVADVAAAPPTVRRVGPGSRLMPALRASFTGRSASRCEGDTESGKPRVVDQDDGAAVVQRAWKRGAVAWLVADLFENRPEVCPYGNSLRAPVVL